MENKNMDNKYKNIHKDNHNVKDILNDYKGPVPAYKPNQPKEIEKEKTPTSIISDDIFGEFDSHNEHTAILEENITNNNHDKSIDILKNIKSSYGFDVNIESSFDNLTSNSTQSYDSVKINENKDKNSIMEQYKKYAENTFDENDNTSSQSDENDFYDDEDYYDEFYDDYGEKIGFFERLRLKREEKKSEKQQAFESDSAAYQEEFIDDYVEPEELDSDYKNPVEARDKLYWLDHMISIHTRQIIALGIISIISLFITLPTYTTINPLFKIMNIEENPRIFVIINLTLILLSIFLNFSNNKRGIVGFFTLNANGNSMLSILTFSTVIYTGFLIYRIELLSSQLIHLYTFLVCFSQFANKISHLIEVLRIRTNFNVISSQKEKIAVEIVSDEELENDMIKLLGDGDPQVVVPIKANFLKRFFELSFDDYYGDSIDKILAPICFGLSVLLAIGTYVLLKDYKASISVFFSSLIISSPLTALLCTNLALFKASKKLSTMGALISGNEAIWKYSQTTSLTVDANQIFPKNSVVLQGIKTFEGGRIDQAILDATSVLSEIQSPLAKTFLEIIENRSELLNKVDSIMYEDEMGVSAWVDDRRILIGNRELMINHGVEVPDKSYEVRYIEDSREIVYLATSGVLTAMYVVKYMAEADIADALFDLNENYVSIIVRTSDPNITPLKISEIFSLSLENIRVIPERRSGPYERVTRPTARMDAKITFMDDILGYFSAIIAAVKLAPTISTSFLIQTIGVVIGFIIIVISTFFSAIVKITPFTLIAYNLFWLLVVTIINSTRKI